MTPESANREVGERLGYLRRYLGHEPDAFAASLGMTTRAYLPYERGERRQGAAWLRVLLAACERTGVSLDWLLRADGSRHPQFLYGHRRRPALRVIGAVS